MSSNKLRLRILVIDDDEAIRESLAFVIKTIGHDVATASNVEEGLAHYAKWHPQVILTDMMMPMGSGLRVIEAVRNDNKDVVIIAISGSDDSNASGLLAKAREAGANYCLNKPFPLAALEQVLNDSAYKF